MPVSGCVISIDMSQSDKVVAKLKACDDVTLYGEDDKGNLIAVLESETSKALEKRVEELQAMEGILSLGMAYINIEDEADTSGEARIQ
jgi:nitrate reductase NapD